MFDGGWAFVRDAGTIIVAVTMIVWAAAYFPRDIDSVPAALAARQKHAQEQLEQLDAGAQTSGQLPADRVELTDQLVQIENELEAHFLENSYLGRAGHWIEPAIKPLGWDWRIGSAVIASFPAREVVVSTLGVIFGLGGNTDENANSLKETLKDATWEGTDKPLFTLPVALSIMVFFALCAQCVSTLAVIRRETNSLRWPIFTFVYMTLLAYVAAFVTFQFSHYMFF
jgi:ferrous iron transport protein B